MPPGYIKQLLLVMKITTLLLFVGLMQVSAAVLAQKLTLEKKDVTLRELFLEINKQTKYNVIWSSEEVDGDQKINAQFKSTPLLEVLDKALSNTELSYTITDETVLIKQKTPSVLDKIKTALNLPITVSGKVTDTLGTPLIGATVANKTVNKSVITNDNGEFNISAQQGDEINITYVGYKPVSFTIANNPTYLTITLHQGTNGLKEVLVNTGYQTLSKERSTGSFSNISGQLLEREVSTDVLSRLDGIASGVLFDKRIHGTGTLDKISVRGLSTIEGNLNPLVVLDNFPYEGDLNNLNPNDIENITILKDAAAASIWGARASNGVIVITTKKGKYNQPLQITLNANVTVAEKPNLFYFPQMSSSDFIDVEEMLFSKGFYNSVLNNQSTRPPVTPVVAILAQQRAGLISADQAQSQINAMRGLDVRNDFEKYIYRKPVSQQYALNISGGTRDVNYTISGGYDHNLNNMIGNEYDRMTLRSMTTIRPVKNLEIQAGGLFTSSHTSTNNSLMPYGYNQIIPGGKAALYPYAQLADASGNPLPIAKDYRPSYTDTAGQGRLLDWKYRPLQEAQLADHNIRSRDILLNLNTRYNITAELNAEFKYQYENSWTGNQEYDSPDSYYTRNLINRYTQLNGDQTTYIIPVGGILDLGNSELSSNDARAQLNYNKNWGQKSELAAIAGMEIRETHANSSSSRTYGYNNDLLTFSNVDFVNSYPLYGNLSFPQPIPNNAGFSDILNRYLSYYVNASYSYDKRYTVSASARKDESNLFGVNINQKGVPLWSSGLSWDVNNEAFYKIDWLPYLRLRVTYGYSGNVDNSLSAYPTIAYQSPNGYTNLPYATAVNPPNPDLRWEKTGILNLGVDFGLKNSRISGSLEYYSKKSTDLISPTPADYTTGFSYLNLNSADMKGKGIEIQLNARIIDGRFKWLTNLIYNYSQSEVTKYDETYPTGNTYVGNGLNTLPLPGKPLNAVFSYKWAGLDPTDGDPQGYVNGQVSKDYNTIINNSTVADLKYDGPGLPEDYGAFRNTFQWKNFSLSANITYRFNYYFRRTSISYSNLFSRWLGNSDYDKRWQKPGDEKTTNVPSLDYPANSSRDNFYQLSEATVLKGDNIRLQDINFSYEITKDQWQGLPVTRLQVYLYANNLGILWRANKYHLDPDYGSYFPAPRTFSLGFKTSF